MSVNLDLLTKECDKRVKQLEHIKEKFGKLTRTDLTVFAPVTYVWEMDKDIERIRSNVRVANDVYDKNGMLTADLTKRFCDYFRAIVVYDEVTFELRQLLDCSFAVNLPYLFLNPEKKQDKDEELSYITDNLAKVEEYLTLQRKRIRECQNSKYVKIDESIPFGL